MKSPDAAYFDLGPRLTLIFGVLIALILGGNGLVVWQFHIARRQTDRLAGANQQLITVLQLQVNLLSFHQRLDDLARSNDAQRLMTEGEPLRRLLRDQAQQTRTAVVSLPTETQVDPAFLPTVEAIEVTLPAQLDAINELAKSGDWGTVQRRLGNELRPIETQTAMLVDSIRQQARDELANALAKMTSAQNVILIVVPTTGVSTFFVATLLGWSVARRITVLRLDERVSERLRITRELHDTLLQTILGSKMIAIAAVEDAADPLQQRPALERLATTLNQAVEDCRATLNFLRASATARNDLAEAFQQAIDDCRTRTESQVTFSTAGDAREMHPIVRDEIYRIGYEAIRNACAHSRATLVEVELRYAQDLTLCVRDNGTGIDPLVLERGKEEHFGLKGIRERAARINGDLTVASAPGSGTEIRLVVPGGAIFRSSPARIGRLGRFRKFLRVRNRDPHPR